MSYTERDSERYLCTRFAKLHYAKGSFSCPHVFAHTDDAQEFPGLVSRNENERGHAMPICLYPRGNFLRRITICLFPLPLFQRTDSLSGFNATFFILPVTSDYNEYKNYKEYTDFNEFR